MLRSDLPSHRRSSEPALLAALGRHEPLALAEACSRMLPVAYAVARRLLPAGRVEALLLAVFEELWESPPEGVALERWVRSRTAQLGLAELRERDAAPALPSVLAIAPDLPSPTLSYLDTTERTLQALPDDDRTALLRAHDEGIPTSAQDSPTAGRDLLRALRVLADPDGDVAEDDVDADGELGDWILGLLEPDDAAAVERDVAADPVRGARVQILRRGRRRIEGLPPTPDLGPRLVAAVLTGLPAEADAGAAADGSTSAVDPGTSAVDPGAEDDTGEIDVVAVTGSGDAGGPVAYRAAPDATDPHGEADATSVLGPLDTDDPTAAGDVVAADVAGGDDPATESALGSSAEASTADRDDAAEEPPSALGGDPYADLRDGDDEPVAQDPDRDPYASLRAAADAAERGDEPEAATPAVDPDDPFADLREPGEDDDEPVEDYGTDPGGRSGLVRLLQVVGILVLIAGGIGLGLLLGQIASGALRG